MEHKVGISRKYRTHTCGQLRDDNNGESVRLAGWVHSRRDHGGVIFIDLRDRYGLTQIVFDPNNNPDVHNNADKLRSEWVIQIEGTVRRRPDGQKNEKMATGEVEVLVTDLIIHNSSKTTPFEIADHGEETNEELRLEYRFLDLRKKRMQDNIIMRHEAVRWSRDYFYNEGFLEIETPILVKGTPEGSREYIVPSRLYPGEFYVLPQAPQQMKQLLMLSGYDKYVQFARCFRDEDQRGDRQPEFTQLDIEMSYVTKEDIMDVWTRWAIGLSKAIVPHKTLQTESFPVMTWDHVMNTYGSDKPDIRFDMPLHDVTDHFKGSGIQFLENVINEGGTVRALVIPGGGDMPRSQIDSYVEFVKQNKANGMAYLGWTSAGEYKGSIAKMFSEDKAQLIQAQVSAQTGDLICFVADEWETAVTALGTLRSELGKTLGLINTNELAYLWVINFPLFEKKSDGSIVAAHHPFCMPLEEHMHLMEDPKTKLDVRSHTYDLVLNGYELGSGSVRIHNQEMQRKVFELLELTDEEIDRQFGHLLKAFAYGVPPHAGKAIGIDRIVMIFADEPNIREVIAFPKNQKARDMMFGAPTPLPKANLAEANISVLEE